MTRKRSFFSFGDIVLPFVGVLAIGLLLVAAKLFFFDAFNDQPPTPGVAPSRTEQSSQDSADNNNPVPAFDPEQASTQGPDPVTEPPNLPAQPEPQEPPRDAPEITKPEPAPVKPATPAPATQTKTAASAPAKPATQAAQTKPATPAAQTKTAAPAPAKPATPAAQPKPAAPAQTKPAAPAPAKSNSSASTNTSNQWRVQVGAYGSKQVAQGIVNDLAKAGYKAVIYPGPRFQKVWVLAGTTQKAAESVRNALKSGGFPDSYLVPPAK